MISLRRFLRVNAFIFTTACVVRRNYCKYGQHKKNTAVSDVTQSGCQIWKTTGPWHLNGTFVLTTTFLEIGTTFECLALLPGCFHNKEWLITIKHIMDVICAILHSNPRQKTESCPHRWCSDSTMKSSLCFSSLMPHVIQMLGERGGKPWIALQKMSASGY